MHLSCRTRLRKSVVRTTHVPVPLVALCPVIFLPTGRSRELEGGKALYDQSGDFESRYQGARLAAICAQAELTACTRVAFLWRDKRQRRRHAGIRCRRARMKEWQRGGVSAAACASHRPMEHGSPLPTQHRPLPSLSLHMRNLLGQCMHSRTKKCASYLPNTAPQVLPPPNGLGKGPEHQQQICIGKGPDHQQQICGPASQVRALLKAVRVALL